jgi:amino acid transporter
MLKISLQASVLSTLSEVFGTVIHHLLLLRLPKSASSRSFFFLGLLAGGPRAMWSSFLISMGGMWATAAVLAEICSALPLSGSIYIWAAESAGPKYARFFGFVVAWWACTAWMTFAAGNCQVRSFSLFHPYQPNDTYRTRRTISFRCWSYTRWTSLAVSRRTTSNGELSCGQFRSVSWSSPSH